MPPADEPVCLTLERAEIIASGDAPTPAEAEHLATCQACRENVDQARADNELFASALGAVASPMLSTDPQADAPAGYRIIEEIHRGAQGVVFLAEQSRTNRRVAIKLTLRGAFASARQRARFDREVELAASLKHPNIVTVFESGATPSGGRYMAMEFIEGLPLDRWFESRGRDPRAVAAVIAGIASALVEAHRKGVIHRDLKPSNILVDAQDSPRIVDFGIAKGLLSETPSETLAGEFVGTLAYAAPEQVEGEPDAVDTRADIYALGALLYLGLTGERPVPLDGALTACVRAIREHIPRPPSTLSPAAGPDLDAIAERALEKHAGDRYQSAQEFEDDLRRYLAGDAVRAREGDAWYALRKWARRRRKRLVLAGVVLAALVVSGSLGADTFLSRQRAAAERAERQRFFTLLDSALAAVDTELSSEAVPALTDYLKKTADILADEVPEDPQLEIALRTRIGLALTRQNEFDAARLQLARAVDLQRETTGDRSVQTAEALHNLARLEWKAGRYSEAEPLYRRALSIRREKLGRNDPATARTTHHLAATLQRLGRYAEADGLYAEALRARRLSLGPEHPDVANTLNSAAGCLAEQRRFDDAIVLFREAHRVIGALAGPDDWRTASAQINIARCLTALGSPADAIPMLEQAIAATRRWWPENDPRVLRARADLAVARGLTGSPGPAADELGEIVAQLANELGPEHDDVTTAQTDLAEMELRAGRPSRALAHIDRVLAVLSRSPRTWHLGHACLIRAEALERTGQPADTERREALNILSETLGPEDPLVRRAAAAGPSQAHRP